MNTRMKKILTLIIAGAFLLGLFSSCTEFLKEEPKSTLTAVGYYQTKDHALSNVNSLYRSGVTSSINGSSGAYAGPFQTLNGILTGYFFNVYEGQELTFGYTRNLTRQDFVSTVSSTVDGVWNGAYTTINRANDAIKNIPNIEMDAAMATQLTAEAKFFRAFNYFYLVTNFGDVPLLTEPCVSLENIYVERAPKASVYAQIESDLNDAMNNLPAAMWQDNGHRVGKYVAAMVLAKVYMMEGKYAEAMNPLNVLLQSPHKLTTHDAGFEQDYLKSAYNKLRTTDDLDEVIWAYEFNSEISTGGNLPGWAFSSEAVALSAYAITERIYGPNNRFLHIYDRENDLRIQPNQFFHWFYVIPGGNANNPDDCWTSPNIQPIYDSDNGNTQQAGCWYYYEEEAFLRTARAVKDHNFYRFAEVLIDAAECTAQSSGVNATAAGYLAQIQARADVQQRGVAYFTEQLQTLSKDEFITRCWNERLREFPLEFKIWDDCLRTGKFPNINNNRNGNEAITYINLVGATNGAGAVIKESDLLWPISVNELSRNPNLTQNPGY